MPSLLKPVRKIAKSDILGTLTDVTLKTEGLIPGQTPLRIEWKEGKEKTGQEGSPYKDTIQGIPIDWEAWRKAPEDRKNFYFVAPGSRDKVIERQYRNYFKSPEDYEMNEEATVEDAIRTFDHTRPENKLNILERMGIDIKKKLKDFDISSLIMPKAYAEETLRPVKKVPLKPRRKLAPISKKIPTSPALETPAMKAYAKAYTPPKEAVDWQGAYLREGQTTTKAASRRIGKIKEYKPSVFKRFTQKIQSFYQVSPAKASNIVALSDMTGMQPAEVEKNYDTITKQLGLRTEPTTEEMVGAMLIPAIGMGLASAPMATLGNIARFMAAKEISERGALPLAKMGLQMTTGQPVDYEITRLREVFPEGLKDVGTLSEFLVYGLGAKGLGKIGKSPRIKGELNSLRWRILGRMGFKTPGTKLIERPLTFEETRVLVSKTGSPVGKYMTKETYRKELAKRKIPETQIKKTVITPKPAQKSPQPPAEVTDRQIKQAHTIASNKALISKKGKPKPGYRRLAKAMTGKTSMKKMTQEEADNFINSLKGLSEPTQTKEGKIKPPRIPTTTRLTTEGYFQRRFKTPTPAQLVTSQTRYAELLGVKDLTEPFEIAKAEMDLEYGNLSRQIEKVVKKVKNTEEMAKALNTSEKAPIDFTPEQKKQFNYFRDLSRSFIKRENEVLVSLGFEPIRYRQAYFRHIADQRTMDILRGEHPLPEGLKYWSEKVVSKKVFNPSQLKRQLKDDLLEYFSKDLEYVSKAMTHKALETIHMSKPKKFFNEQLRALSQDKPIYKNLTSEQKKFYEAQQVLPAKTKEWLLDYINIQLGNRQTGLDESVNRFVTDSKLKDILNNVLKPFGKVISQRPVTNMIQRISRLPIYGAMGGLNPRQIIRNKFQRLQDIALYGVKNTLKGFLPTNRESTSERLKSNSLFKRSYSGFEEMPAQLRHKAERIGLAPYQWSAQSNVSQSMDTSYYWTKDKIVNPKNKHLGWASPKRTYKEPRGFFYPEEEARLLKEMEYGAHTTQYQYIGMGMPGIFRYKSAAGLTRLQSWWMNHWFIFHREAITRAFTGHTGYNPDLKLTAGDRFNYLKYLILGGVILINLGYERSYLWGTAPTALPPTGQLAMGLYQWFANQGDESWQKRKRAQASYHIKNALKIHIPGYLSVKDLTALIKGDKQWYEYLFYFKEKGGREGIKPLK